MSRKLFSRAVGWRRRPAAPLARATSRQANLKRPIIRGRAWQSEPHRRRRAEMIDRTLHWLCCILVPGLFLIVAWVFCIYRLAKWLTNY